jgi:aryl-alcohol dehydrogenase-like predicted oxidoreductase
MDFRYREVAALGGRRVFRLGLATNYGVEEAGVRAALDRGVNYLFYTWRSGSMRSPLREALGRRRDQVVVATLPLIGYFGGSVRRSAERALKHLGTDYLDVFQLGWLGVTSAWTDATVKELVHLKETGKVRAIGISIHDRERAGRLAADSPLDVLMIRYNAAHPGAERDIFPHLERRRPMVVAYTATRWRKLLKRPRGWQGPVMSAGDCYRFCLTSPHVDVVLTGPASAAELDENLAALDKGPLSDDETRWMREFGRAVHG